MQRNGLSLLETNPPEWKTHVLRGHSTCYENQSNGENNLIVNRLYVFQNITHNGQKYYINNVIPTIYVIKQQRGHAYSETKRIEGDGFLIDGHICGYRKDNYNPQLWFPSVDEESVVFDIINNDANRGGEMFAAGIQHHLIINVRFRIEKECERIYDNYGIGIDAVHATDFDFLTESQSEPQDSGSNFLLFFT